ncbi:MAG: hypothetical protein WC149_09105, partial [Arcobacteraceae bacterium]
MKNENYVKVYELFFENEKELNRDTLIKKFQDAIKNGYQASTGKGLFYIKEIKKGTFSDVILFGKDNEDASNYKREKERLSFKRIDINVKKEVLTDFIHISISNIYDAKRSDKIRGCTILVEKSSLIQIKAFEEFLGHFVGDYFLTSIRRRVAVDYYSQIKNATRIMKISQVKKDTELPLTGKKKKSYDDI